MMIHHGATQLTSAYNAGIPMIVNQEKCAGWTDVSRDVTLIVTALIVNAVSSLDYGLFM